MVGWFKGISYACPYNSESLREFNCIASAVSWLCQVGCMAEINTHVYNE